MSHGYAFEEVVLALRPSLDTINHSVIAIKDTLRAVCCAKCLDWIDFRQDFYDDAPRGGPIVMEECIHYSRHATRPYIVQADPTMHT
jgi:hypothetical protein